MAKLPKPISINQPNPEIPTEQATIVSLAKNIIEIKEELNEQRKENKNQILWIIGGVVAIVAVVAIEIIIFHTRDNKGFFDLQNNYFQELQSLRDKDFEMGLRLQQEIDALKIPLPVLQK